MELVKDDVFIKVLEELARSDLTSDKKDIERLSDFCDSGFRDRLQADDASKSALKLWDGFHLALGDGGATITKGDTFRYWISFR